MVSISSPPSVVLDTPFTITWSRGQGEASEFAIFLADDTNQTLSGPISNVSSQDGLSGQVAITMSSSQHSPGYAHL